MLRGLKVFHQWRLACGVDDIAPERTIGVDGISLRDSKFDWQMDKMVIEETDEQAGLSGHSGVDGVRAESFTINCIIRISGSAADDVTGVNVFNGDLDFSFHEVIGDFILQKSADVGQFFKAPGVKTDGFTHKLLASTLCDDNDGVMTVEEPSFEMSKKAIITIEVKGNFGDEDEVDIVHSKGGMCGDKT